MILGTLALQQMNSCKDTGADKHNNGYNKHTKGGKMIYTFSKTEVYEVLAGSLEEAFEIVGDSYSAEPFLVDMALEYKGE